jgi:hypothetical protein
MLTIAEIKNEEIDVRPCVAVRATLSDGKSWYVSYSPLLYGLRGATQSFRIVGDIDGLIDWASEGQGPEIGGYAIADVLDSLCAA